MLSEVMQKILVTLFLSLLFISCSEQVYEYEEKIREELKATNQTMSEIEIKKTAIYLSEWTEPSFYQGAIDDFKKNDTLKSPPKDSILFIGSSSIVYWKTLKEDMSPHEVINRGFGGAHIAHINNHFNEVVTAYKPKGIVFFCGTNDLTAFKSVNQVFNDFLLFYENVKEALPKTKVFVIGVKPTIARYYLRDKQLIINNLIAELAENEKNLIYIDVWDEMLLEDGKANPSLFVEDGLHMNENGYLIWKDLVKPHLDKNFKPHQG